MQEAAPAQPAATKKPKEIKAGDLKKGDRVMFDGRPHSVGAVGKPNAEGFRKVVFVDDEGEKVTQEMEAGESLAPVVEKAASTEPAVKKKQVPPALANAKKLYASELEPGQVLLNPDTGEELGIVIGVKTKDKNGNDIEEGCK